MLGIRTLQDGDPAVIVLSVYGDHQNGDYSMGEKAIHKDDVQRYISLIKSNPCVSAWPMRQIRWSAHFAGDHA